VDKEPNALERRIEKRISLAIQDSAERKRDFYSQFDELKAEINDLKLEITELISLLRKVN